MCSTHHRSKYRPVRYVLVDSYRKIEAPIRIWTSITVRMKLTAVTSESRRDTRFPIRISRYYRYRSSVNRYRYVIRYPLLDGQDPSDTSFVGDLFQKSREYIEWLNSKPQSSVVYISFGTMIVLPKQQKEEIMQGLLETHLQFLWVMRPKETHDEEKEKEDEAALSCMEELEQ
ncbi:hypothetical protein HYC85_017522 [Camellia sinensis]|uniref:Uncharacterized protein n=1 Tax=Camellia sinensis TaxID=4442 RepID=A0A7J7GTC8_CAMSI|nr:hypothetical protein HYC85_017522 [Camellia sinensis]